MAAGKAKKSWKWLRTFFCAICGVLDKSQVCFPQDVSKKTDVVREGRCPAHKRETLGY